MDNQSKPLGQISTRLIANTPAASAKAKSTSALTQAIHSAGDDAYTLDRTRTCLKLYYDPDMSAADRADMMDSYRKALSSRPKWAVAKAFDEWERTGTRRPSPADLDKLAGKAMQVLTDEIARRKKDEAVQAPRFERTDDEQIGRAHV